MINFYIIVINNAALTAARLTKAAFGDDGFGGVGGRALAALVDSSHAELVRLALGETVDGTRSDVAVDVLSFLPLISEFLLRVGAGRMSARLERHSVHQGGLGTFIRVVLAFIGHSGGV